MAQFEPQRIKKTDIKKSSKSPSVPSPGQSNAVTSPLTSPQQSDFQSAVTPAIVSSPFPGNEKEIQVEAGEIHYIFSNKGGVIKHILLPRFRNDDGDVIDLINNPDNLTGALSIKSDDPEITSILQNAYYEPSTSSIVLDESNPEGVLTLTLKHESGLEVFREFKFHHNDCLLYTSPSPRD